jgi:branched-chain amino acid transport system substrate-binding protein
VNLESRKFALLIGVSECASGFKKLNCPHNGTKALSDILTNPDIGGFSPDRVLTLSDPGVGEMQAAIGKIFSRCSHQDMMLLYFTGHGVTDQHGDLFFTTRETEIEEGRLNRGTSVTASFVRNEMMRCNSRRQVVILDCCFSGAFPDGVLSMNDGSINIEQQLGGEGRVILTATNSTQYASERQGEDLSDYTRYLVQGLATGAALSDNQESIGTTDIHRYICNQMRTANIDMHPQSYGALLGERDIVLGRVLNIEQKCLDLVQKYRQPNGQVSDIGQDILNEFAAKRGMTKEQLDGIITGFFQSPEPEKSPLDKYTTAFQREASKCYPLSKQSLKELHDYQQLLKLKDEDVAPIHDKKESEYKLTLKQEKYDFSMKIGCMSVVLLLIGIVVNSLLNQPKTNPQQTATPPSQVTSSPSTATPNIEIKNLISAGDNEKLYGSRRLGKRYQDAANTGIEKFKQGDYRGSYAIFKSIRDVEIKRNNDNPNTNISSSPRKDPEILIFQNNSEARMMAKNKQGSEIYTIAVAIPLSYKDGTSFNIGQQVLFGVAQAQTRAISQGINLEVVIANDLNDSGTAIKLAQELSKPFIIGSDKELLKRKILAIIGHYSSTVTCQALTEYNKAGLAVISPLSKKTDMRKCGGGNTVFFRTISSSHLEATALVDYLLKNKIESPKIAVFYKKGEDFSEDLLREFRKYLAEKNIQIKDSDQFDLSNKESPDFNNGISRIKEFNVVAVFPDGQTNGSEAFNNAIELIKPANPQKEQPKPISGKIILGSNPLTDWKIAQYGEQLKVSSNTPGKGLILAIDWIPACANTTFISEATDIQGGPPTRIVALSDEAVEVVVDRISRKKINRLDILSDLGMPNQKIPSYVFEPCFSDSQQWKI